MAEENKDTNSPTQESEQKEEASDESSAEEDSKMEVEEPKETKKVTKKEEKQTEDAEEDDEELVGLLEKPVVLQDGLKRERKKVERMSFQLKESEEKKLNIKKGSGVALGDIPFVDHKINRAKGETLKPLYRILFRKTGKAATCKKFIRQFSGFPFKKSEDEYEKRLAILKNKSFTLAMIKEMCDVLDLQRQGTKDEVIERVLEFLMCPKDSGKKVPTPKRKRAAAAKKDKPATKKEKPSKSDKSDDEAGDSDSEEEDDKEKDDSSDDDNEPPKKKVKAVSKVSAKKTTKPKDSPQKKTTPSKKKDKDDDVSDISSDDSDDEPIKKSVKPKVAPTNDELKDVIKKMLDNADLEAVTMKTVLKDVFAKYPEFDLSDRKEFIKNTVKQIIS